MKQIQVVRVGLEPRISRLPLSPDHWAKPRPTKNSMTVVYY